MRVSVTHHDIVDPQKSQGDLWEIDLLPTVSEERGVLGVGIIPVIILPSCQDMKTVQ